MFSSGAASKAAPNSLTSSLDEGVRLWCRREAEGRRGVPAGLRAGQEDRRTLPDPLASRRPGRARAQAGPFRELEGRRIRAAQPFEAPDPRDLQAAALGTAGGLGARRVSAARLSLERAGRRGARTPRPAPARRSPEALTMK